MPKPSVVITTHDACHQEVHHFIEAANSLNGPIRLEKVRLGGAARDLQNEDTVDAAAAFKQAAALRADLRLDDDCLLVIIVAGNLCDEKDDEYFIVPSIARDDDPAPHTLIVSLHYLSERSSFMRDGAAWWSSVPAARRRLLVSNSILNLLLGSLAYELVSEAEWHEDARGCVMDECQNPVDLVKASGGTFQFCAQQCEARLSREPGPFLKRLAARLTESSGVDKRWRPDPIVPQNTSPTPNSAAAEQGINMALVLKGGGVKGLALAGALEVLEPHYAFTSFVGTSAGAIAAVLLASGYRAAQLTTILREHDFRTFLDRPKLRQVWNFVTKGWLNSGKPVEAWVARLVHDQIPREADARMRDLPRRVIVYAANERDGTVEFDSKGPGQDVPVQFAVRCSMSIPYFFAPCQHAGEEIFDGGLLNNFPLEKFLTQHQGDYVALYLSSGRAALREKQWRPFRLLNILLGRDERVTVDKHADRVISIDPSPVRTTQFNLSETEKDFLLAAGRAAAFSHLGKVRPSAVTPDQVASAVSAANALRTQVLDRVRRRRRRRLTLTAVLILALVAASCYMLRSTV